MKQSIWFRRNCLIILESLNWITFWKFYGCGYIEQKLTLYVTDITIIMLHVLTQGGPESIVPVIWNYKWRNRIRLLKVLCNVKHLRFACCVYSSDKLKLKQNSLHIFSQVDKLKNLTNNKY